MKLQFVYLLVPFLILTGCKPKEEPSKQFNDLTETVEKRIENNEPEQVTSKFDDLEEQIISLGLAAEEIKTKEDALDLLEQYFMVIYKWKTFKIRLITSQEEDFSPEVRTRIEKFEDEEYQLTMEHVAKALHKYRDDEDFRKLEQSLIQKYTTEE